MTSSEKTEANCTARQAHWDLVHPRRVPISFTSVCHERENLMTIREAAEQVAAACGMRGLKDVDMIEATIAVCTNDMHTAVTAERARIAALARTAHRDGSLAAAVLRAFADEIEREQ